MRQLSFGLESYHNVHGSLPPTQVADKAGRPLHSWRVLQLPFLEQQILFDRYCFDEPWDGPKNSRLHDADLSTYRCPSDQRQKTGLSSYLGVVGPAGAWNETELVFQGQSAEEKESSILILEVNRPKVHWMQPLDRDIRQLISLGEETAEPPGQFRLSSDHPDVAHVLLDSGEVRALSTSIVRKAFRELLPSENTGKSKDVD